MRYSLEDWRIVLLRDPCVYCGALPTGLDHIRPRSLRGDDGWENRAPACATCDGRKAQRPLLHFLAERHNCGSLPTRRLRPEPRWSPPPLTFRMSIPMSGSV